jgi:20S proteasome subunit alpha 5
MTLEQAENLALSTLRQVMEEKVNSTNVEVASVRADTKKFHVYSPDELQRVCEFISLFFSFVCSFSIHFHF